MKKPRIHTATRGRSERKAPAVLRPAGERVWSPNHGDGTELALARRFGLTAPDSKVYEGRRTEILERLAVLAREVNERHARIGVGK